MPVDTTDPRSMTRIGAVLGLSGVAAYFGAVFVPLPDLVGQTLAFAFGPLLGASFLGLHRALASHRDGYPALLGCVFGVVAGAIVTTMLVVQVGNNIWRAEGLAAAETEAAREAAQLVWRAVNRVQALLDVSWDIFICAATVLVAIAMLRHPRFGPLLGAAGIVAGLLLLALNLYTFPTAPHYAGLVDLGPLVAVWYLVVFVWMLMIARRPGKQPG